MITRSVHPLKSLVVVVAVLCAWANPIAAAKPAADPGGHMRITGVFIDYDVKEMVISGEDFDFGNSVSINLENVGDITDSCVVMTQTIRCSFWSGLPDAGDYLLTVASGSGQSQGDAYALTFGAVGPQGEPGADGADGEQGPVGPQGPQGEPGTDGAQGPTGPQGPKGESGKDGEDGTPGIDGKDGIAGKDGADGAQGPAGSQGPQGQPGKDGFNGAPGRDGIDGAPGVQGIRGEKGDRGPKGAKGDPGVSNYQVVDKTCTREDRGFLTCIAECPDGTVVFGGGHNHTGLNCGFDLGCFREVTASNPTGRGWRAQVFFRNDFIDKPANDPERSRDLKVFAICASVN